MVETNSYSPVIPNAVYGKTIEVTTRNGKIELPAFILLSRFQEPTEDQVVKYLQKKAKELQGAASLALPQGVERPNRSILEQAIMRLPDRIIRGISIGDEALIDFIRASTRAQNLPEGTAPNQYLSMRYGILHPGTLEANSSELDDPLFYAAVFSDEDLLRAGLGEQIKVQLALNDWNLPDRETAKMLISHGVYGSRILKTSNEYYPPELVEEIVDFSYNTFPDRSKLLQIADGSEKKLDASSFEPIGIILQRAKIAESVEEDSRGRKRKDPNEPKLVL